MKKIKAKILTLLITLSLTLVPSAALAAGTSPESLADGNYEVAVDMTGGSGRATIQSPCQLIIQNGQATATIEWSSPNYDYMIVDDTQYLPTNTEGNSVFEIPVTVLDEPMDVIGDTVAMSTPHEIEYQLTFHSKNIPAQASGHSQLWTTLPILLVVASCAIYFYNRKKRAA